MDLRANGERRMGMNELLEAQKRLEERVDELDEAIRGNGKPGINQRLMRIEDSLARMDKWFEIVVKVMLPILLSTLGLGILAWINSVV